MISKMSLRVIHLVAVAALVTPLGALGDVVIQNAQFNGDKGVIYVKGKLTGNSTETKVYVVDVTTQRPISGNGEVDTFSRDSQFSTEVPVSGQVPCYVRVQTNKPGVFSRFFGASSWGTGDFSIAEVRHSPSCASS